MAFGDQIYRQTNTISRKHHECSSYIEENNVTCHA